MLAIVVLAALTGDQVTVLICTLISAIVGPIAVVVVTQHAGRKVGDKVDAVHQEIRPPSNGTTAGAQLEFASAWTAWLYEELVAIGQHLGIKPHAPVPELPEADVPPRPEERRRLGRSEAPNPVEEKK